MFCVYASSLGLSNVEDHHSLVTVYPRHQEVYGLGWKSRKVRCSVPSQLAGHKSSLAKGDHDINSNESFYILFAGKAFLLSQYASRVLRMT